MTSRRIARLLLLLAGIASGAAHAAEFRTQAVVETDLASFAPPLLAPIGWATLSRDDVFGAICAPRDGAVLRVALTTRPLSRWQRDACVATAAAGVSDHVVGRLVLLAFAMDTPPVLTTPLLYRALAARVPAAAQGLVTNTSRSWKDLDPQLPDAPIRVLLPPAGSAEDRILRDEVLYQGCVAVALPLLPHPADERRALCTGIRSDAAVARPAPGAANAPGGGAGAWLRAAGPSAVALVGLDTMRADPGLDTPLSLDGITPGFASIANGTYSASLPVHLVMAQAGAAAAASRAVGILTAESVIGPAGGFAQHGLAALTAAERVRLRAE